MKNGLNDEQNLFVETTNNNILVSASAGSGKTTTMIEKLKKLILEDKVPVENLLVVTFTEAAASEMKQKLYTKLAKEISSAFFTSSIVTALMDESFSSKSNNLLL